MRLLYLHQYFTFPDTSGGTRSYDLATQFIKNGIDVIIITSSANLSNIELNKRWTYIEKDNIKLWILRCNYSQRMSILRRIISFFEFVFFTSIKIIKIKTDFVLATSTPLTISIPAIIKKKISKTPFIFEVRDVWPENPIQQGYVKNHFLIKILRKSEKYIYKQACYVVPLSTGMEQDILSRVDVPNIEVIPNISEINRFKDLKNKINLNYNLSEKKIILYAGTLGAANNLLYVAKLAERMIHIEPNIVFLIIGNGKEKQMIIDYCTEVEIINKNIFFLDPISKNSLPYIYSISTMGSSFVRDCKIMWDNSANKFFDTLAAGRPILINHQGWQADVINEKRCGYVLPPNLTDNDVEKFATYLMDDDLLKEHGKNALITAEEYSLETVTKKYMKIFKSLHHV